MAELYFNSKKCNQFVRDLDGEVDLRYYEGRGGYTGPGASADYFHDVSRHVHPEVRLQHDSLGLGVIVYPVGRGKLVSREEFLAHPEWHPVDWEIKETPIEDWCAPEEDK